MTRIELSPNRRLAHFNARLVVGLLLIGAPAIAVGITSASGASHSNTKGLVISSVTSTKFGTILVSGRTLYTLKPGATACAKSCHKYWVEVLLPKGVQRATAGAGVSAAKLGTVKGVGGALQVTYGGRALYWFFLDKAPGQIKGNVTDTWGKWSDVVLVKPAHKSTTTTTEPTVTTTSKPTTTTTAKPPVTTTSNPTTTTSAPGGGGGVGF